MSRTSHAVQAEVVHPIQRIFYTSPSDVIKLGSRIGIGAEGEVYEIQDRTDLVAKLYHEPPSAEKAEKFVVLSRLGNERLFNLSAWPVDALRDAPDGAVVGFVMKKINRAEEVHTLHSPKSRLQKFPEASWSFLIYVAANIARAVAAIHEHGLVIGDLNPKNILVTRKATVSLLDVDSFQVSVDGKTYRCDGGFPEYTPPELQGVAFREVDRRQEHDCFGLAVIIFQLLFLGRHPFSGNFLGPGEMSLERAIREFRFAYGADAEKKEMRQPPGTLALDSMPLTLVDLFRRAFMTSDRPQPRDWIEPLDELAKSLKKCGMHSGHFYYKELSECPWCGIEIKARVKLFNFLISEADLRREHFRLDEIWKEVKGVKPPAPPAKDKLQEAAAPSVEVGFFDQKRRKKFFISIAGSVAAGLLLPLMVEFPFAFFLIVWAGIAACCFAKAGWSATGQSQTIFQSHRNPPEDPFLRKVWTQRRDADYKVRELEERWEKEASDKRFHARLDDLRNWKETYENLPNIRQFKLRELESESREKLLNVFLKQFDIQNVEIKGIGSNVKKTLLSKGVGTAADIIDDVTSIPSIGRSRAEKLLQWRRDLESNFIFDPGQSVSHQDRIKTEREVDTLRFRLESELTGAPHFLSRLKHEIETSRQKLQPDLSKARRELAQAEKDFEVASKRNSGFLILCALIIATICGCALISGSKSEVVQDDNRPITGNGGASETRASSKPVNSQDALKLYLAGTKLAKEGKYKKSVDSFRKAVDIDPGFHSAHYELGVSLFRLKKYDEAEDALKTANGLNSDFMSFYYLGLVHANTDDWEGAKDAFQRAVELRELSSSWSDYDINAYYYLGLSLVKTGEVHQEIKALDADIEIYPGVPLKRFELANLYLCVGYNKAAKMWYQYLRDNDPELARVLKKLMKKHGVRVPA